MSIHPTTRELIKLTTHPSNFGVDPEPMEWAARDPRRRGAVVATVSKPGMRNSIGAHSGTYSVYRAVALAVQAACVCQGVARTVPAGSPSSGHALLLPAHLCCFICQAT